jgi:hypothetical protein
MPNDTWYIAYQHADLEQGDILFKCPCLTIGGLTAWPPKPTDVLKIEEEPVTAIILTQTCDLEHEKVDNILFGRVLTWETACRDLVDQGDEYAKSSKYRKALVDGNVPGLFLLHKFDDLQFPWSVVTFHQLFTLPRKLIHDVVDGGENRLRMLSPYKEHLAQAFARYFMRVGLPLEAKAFEKEGQVQFRK